MSSKNRLSLAVLALLAAAPLASLACGGSTPPAESAAEGTPSAAPAPEAPPAAAAPSAAPAAEAAPSAAPAETAAAAPAPPAAPSIASSDCGKCLDTACTKQHDACAKETDCSSMVDAFHNCSSDKGVAACLDSATPPTAAKPKKLASAWDACIKKAAASKACKTTCKP